MSPFLADYDMSSGIPRSLVQWNAGRVCDPHQTVEDRDRRGGGYERFGTERLE